MLQARLYRNGDHVDYLYQILRGTESVIRWDNKKHFPKIASYPRHFHSAEGDMRVSPSTGNVTHDLPIVLNTVASSGSV